MRTTRLTLEALEGREVPAGNITATVTGGRLVLTGDDEANTVEILVTAFAVVLTPDNTTRINAGAAGATAVLGTATALRASMGNGNDLVYTHFGEDFSLPRGATFDLGEGNDTLRLITDGKLSLGNLAVRGGDGDDLIAVRGGVVDGGTIGVATVDFGSGVADLQLGGRSFLPQELTITGPGGLRVKAAGGGIASIRTDYLTVNRTFMADLGNSLAELRFLDSQLGALVINGINPEVSLTQTAVTGKVAIKSANTAVLKLSDARINGAVSVSAAIQASFSTDAGFNSVGSLNVVGGLGASLSVVGSSLGVRSNVTVSSPGSANIFFEPSLLSMVGLNLTLNGGYLQDTFQILGGLQVFGNVTVNLGPRNGFGDESNYVLISSIFIERNLTINGGVGSDDINLDGARVGGTTRIVTGSGDDVLSIEYGSSFFESFFADLGAGRDFISIGTSAGSAQPVTFSGKAMMTAGAGDDTLELGRSAAAGGDANSRAVFNTAGSKLDGGAGTRDTFDDDTAEFTGLIPLTGIVGWEIDP